MAVDEENQSKKEGNTNTDAQEVFSGEEPAKINKLGVAAFVVIFLLVLIVGGTLNANSDSEDSTKQAVDSAPTSDVTDAPAPMTPPLDYSNYYFNRIATFPVCMQLDDTCNTDQQTVAEIVQASEDGMMIAYTDGTQNSIGFIDISDPMAPMKAGLVNVGGETTSLVIKGKYVAVGVNTSPDFVNPSGNLQVIDMETQAIVANIDMGGQPDSVALSPDKKFMAIAIENERDEDLNGGLLPQLPAGFLQIVDCSSEDPTEWTATKVEMTGLDGVLYNSDPEPEFVSINSDNIAVVTLQENNGLVLVDLANAEIMESFSAGTTTVTNVDITEEDIIEQNGSVTVPREPDGVTWIGTEYFATADEGDLDGGSRGFTIFDTTGAVVYESGNMIDELTIRYGHYPDARSENKGNEPENVLYAEFESLKLLFVGSERSSLVFVFEVSDITNPVFRQVLPTGVKPEGKFAIPSRNLLVVAAEEDSRADKMRSAVTVYHISETAPVYPNLVSANGDDGNPIPFSALSGLSFKDGMLYTVEDSYFKQSRMFAIDPSAYPYTVTTEVKITDTNDVLSAILDANATAVIMNNDKTVNLDLEGIEAVDDGFWLVSEGSGTVDDAARPVTTPNLLLKVDAAGVVNTAVTLPAELNAGQLRFGLEGVAVEGDNVVVAFQRAWTALGDTEPRLGIYSLATDSWSFVFYPLDTPESQNGGWVGLSDIASLGNGEFLILERDNQGLTDAAIKKIYKIDLGDFSIADGVTVQKTFVHDLTNDLMYAGGLVTEKVEGLTVDASGNIWVNNDNDGVDDHSGEQFLLNIGPVN
ncbi:unnamed protein product [Cylindrotheca closterium]|uniref:Phytase-like domain-containing protein n=1 Tax=Cylindrotheca closterium TaxID=2856 RepID=A0AAD2G3E7_9STRA|nr:unnamed protein product [Cylindrotheca closterium]